MGSNVQRHDSHQRQRRKEGLHHGQHDGGHRPQISKALQQTLPKFQRTQLVEPLHPCTLHSVRPSPFRASGERMPPIACSQPGRHSISSISGFYEKAMNKI